jgi:hypothetical protein
LIAQPLFLQARSYACPQQGRIERLGEIVIGAGLDAADDRVELTQCRNHYGGNIAVARIALEAREDIIAADAGHHQIEQDEIDGLRFDQGERANAVLGL